MSEQSSAITIRYKTANRKRTKEISDLMGHSENAFIDLCIAGILDMIDCTSDTLPVPKIVQMARSAISNPLYLKPNETADTITQSKIAEAVEKYLLKREDSYYQKSKKKTA